MRCLFLSVALKQIVFVLNIIFQKGIPGFFFGFFFFVPALDEIFLSVSHGVIYRTSGLHNQLCFQHNIYIIPINV